MKRYDVAIIGAGPGGYVAAIRCAQLGMNTVCIDNMRDHNDEPSLGGVCLNVGCIPSKALLDSSEQYYNAKNHFSEHGIKIDNIALDLDTLMSRKNNIVKALTSGISVLFMKNKIDWLPGKGRLISNKQIEIIVKNEAGEDVTEVVEAPNIIIATGSSPAAQGSIELDGDRIVDSTGALFFDEVPTKMAVIGGGVIGLELGSVWSRLGAEVIVLNRGAQFLSRVEPAIARESYRLLQNKGLDIRLGAAIKEVTVKNKQVSITYQDEEGEQSIQVDRLLVATGRTPNSGGLNSDAVGLNVDEKGFIEVDEHCQTNLKGVYAIGDVVRGPMLAHKASEEGVAVAEQIAGQSGHVNYKTIPWVIYTSPEIAWVGKTSQQLTEEGIEFKEGSFPFKANGRAHAMNETDGMVKILSDAKYDRILGVHILGPHASELIAEVVLAMEFNASAEDIARTVHAHPTLSEAMHEAALAVDNRTIHI